MKNVWLGIAALSLVLGCGSQQAPASQSPKSMATSEKVKPAPTPAEALREPTPDEESTRLIAEMLDKVARVRGLPIKKPVPGKVLDRDALRKHIRDMVTEEIPREVLVAQGDMLAAVEMVPSDYDFSQGMMTLMGGRVAGLYDPKEAVMILAGDLGEAEMTETLAHELAHALVDQSFPLAPYVKYIAGEGDRSSAVHGFIEGDATSAMLDVMIGSAFDMDVDAMRFAFVASTLLSDVGATTPRAISSSLVTPYIDGFACIQALRRLGDWRAVDDVWRKLPETTEQLLHLDKLLTREPAELIATPVLGPLERDGYKIVVEDVMGEQGLRIWLEDIASRRVARDAAAGWGGDKIVVAERTVEGKRQVAVVYRLRMDTVADAIDVKAQFDKKYGSKCRERKDLGPVAWEIKDRDILLVAGPFERRAPGAVSVGTCALSKTWLAEAWTAAPPVKETLKQRAGR